MPLLTRKRTLAILLLLILSFTLWVCLQQYSKIALEKYVPATALGYVEVNDIPHLIEGFTSSEMWQKLAPDYGVQDKFQLAGWANRLAHWTGFGTNESLVMARGQFALVVSGIEIRGDEVKPRLALIVEANSSSSRLQSLVEKRLPQLATRAYKNPIRESSDYQQIPITIFRSPQGERRLFSAISGSVWVLANDPETLQSCLDVQLGRAPSIAENKLLDQARAEVDRNADIFAFISDSGASRLSQFFTYLFIGKSLESTPLAGLPEGLMSDISKGTIEAIAYSASFDGTGINDLYSVLCKPEVSERIQSAIRIPDQSSLHDSRALRFVPADVQEATLVRFAEPGMALDRLEQIVSSNLGVAQSLLFHRFSTSARKTFFGLEAGEDLGLAVGSEVLRISLPTDLEQAEKLWIIDVRSRTRISQIAERLLRQQGSGVKRMDYRGIEITYAGNEKRAFAIKDDFLLLGSKSSVIRFLDELKPANKMIASASFSSARLPQQLSESVMVSFSNESAETNEMMMALARWLKAKPAEMTPKWLTSMPMAVTVTAITERGMRRETRSSSGNLPLIIAFIEKVS